MSYDKESFMKGLAVGRILWKPPRPIPNVEVFIYTINVTPITGLTYPAPSFQVTWGETVIVEWGDGTESTYTRSGGDTTHTYEEIGQYRIRITGKMDVFSLHGDFVVSIDSPLPSTIVTAASIFSYCRNLTKVSQHVFRRCGPSTQDFSYCFAGCSKLKVIPEHLFDRCNIATNFSYCFYECNALEVIPDGLFKNCGAATTMAHAFDGGSYAGHLTSIPGDMFHGCENITNFQDCFARQPIRSIPSTLFSTNTAAEDFGGCFFSNDALVSIPGSLFERNQNALSFTGTFVRSHITSIPSTLFQNCELAESFSRVFDHCQELSSIPGDLFSSCPNAKNFTMAFDRCQSVTSSVPNLWETHPDADGSYCFRYCYSAANYADIPVGWK